MTLDLNDPVTAQALNRIIEQKVDARIAAMTPRLGYGTVASVDRTTHTAGVYLVGSASATPGIRYEPLNEPIVGDRVRVATAATGDRYIEGVYPVAVGATLRRATTGNIEVVGPAAAQAYIRARSQSGQTAAFEALVEGDTYARASLRGDASYTGLVFGPGNATQDWLGQRRRARQFGPDEGYVGGGPGLRSGAGGSGTGGQWAKFAHGSITAQYQNSNLVLLVTGWGHSTGTQRTGILQVNIKQQLALGSAPEVTLRWLVLTGLSATGAVLVVTANSGSTTDYELHLQSVAAYEYLQVNILHEKASADGGWAWDHNQTYAASPPAGTGGAAQTFSRGPMSAMSTTPVWYANSSVTADSGVSYYREASLGGDLVHVEFMIRADSTATAARNYFPGSGLPAPRTSSTVTPHGMGRAVIRRASTLAYTNYNLVWDGSANWFLVPEGGTVATGYSAAVAVDDIIWVNMTYEQ